MKFSAFFSFRSAFAVAFLVALALFAPLLAKKALRTSVSALAEKFPLKKWFVEINGGMHRLTGRRLCNTVYRTPSGILLSQYRGKDGIAKVASNTVAFSEWLASHGIPYIYVQVPGKIDMGVTMLPHPLVNMANARTDEFLATLAARSVRTLDIRRRFSATPSHVERYFYRTDHHWNNDAVFEAFGIVAREIAGACGDDPAVVARFVSPDSWHREVWPQCFMGSKARRTGRCFGGLDDLIVHTPLFETRMSLAIPTIGVAREGSFRETVMYRAPTIMRKPGAYTTMAYINLYAGVGGSYGEARHRNPDAPLKRRVMLMGDSFVRPVECMLSTIASEILCVDQRRLVHGETAAKFVEEFKPDVVVQMCNAGAFFSDMLTGPKTGRSVLFEYGELR